jgi:hypothetical protein
MRKVLLLLPGLLILSAAFGQTTELGLSLNSGLFSFAGRSAGPSSFINYNTPQHAGYTNNPYGSKTGWCDGMSVDLRRVTRRRLLFGVSLGYEVLRSQVSLTGVSVYTGTDVYNIGAQGHTDLTSRFINLFPFVGYRFTPGKMTVDVTGGLDLGHFLSARENGKARDDNGTTYISSWDRKTISTDIRPRLQLSAGYRRAAVYVGYSYGLSNYMKGYVGGPVGAYGRLLRFGVQYRLN